MFVETFADPGSRIMADLDVLVPESAAQDCWEALCRTGYRPVASSQERPRAGLPPIDYRVHHHLRPLHCPGEYGEVEIHRSAVPESKAALLPLDVLWANATSIQEAGVSMGIPAPTDRILNNLVHSALVDRMYVRGGIPLRSLHELAEMQSRYGDRIDWKLIRRRFEHAGHWRVLRGMLYLAHRYFLASLPESIKPSLRACVHSTRARLQVRWHRSEALVARALWFSAEDICDRYQCASDSWSIAKGRIRLASGIAGKIPGKAFVWTLNRLGIGKTAG